LSPDVLKAPKQPKEKLMTKRNVMHEAVRYALFVSTGALALNMGAVTAQ